MEYAEVFERFDIFEGLDDGEKKELSTLFKRANFAMDDVIYEEGGKGGTLYFLLSGKVRVYRRNKDGDLLPLFVVREGDTFGLMSFIDGSSHNAATIADKDSQVVSIAKEDFETLLDKDPMMFAKVYKKIGIHLCDIIRDMNKQYTDLTSYMFTKSK